LILLSFFILHDPFGWTKEFGILLGLIEIL